MGTKIAFRLDGSTAIGMGHVMNSLAVAEELQKYPVEIYFVMKKFPEAIAKVGEAGYAVEELETNLSEQQGFQKTIKILQKKETTLLVTDLLEIQDDYSPELQKKRIKCISIDILGKIKLKSDVIINRTSIAKRFEQYDKNQPTQYYLGPKYVPLRKDFAGLDKVPHQINPQVQKVLLCFGGGDEYNLSARVAWIMGKFPTIKTTIILGAAFKLEEELLEIVNQLPNKPAIIKDSKNMKELLLESDLAVCAGGSILYELAITGTPAVIIPMNDHQVENAEEFEKFGSVISVGLHSEIEDEDIKEALQKAHDSQLRKNMSEAGKKITDGRGAERIAEIISAFTQENIPNNQGTKNY